MRVVVQCYTVTCWQMSLLHAIKLEFSRFAKAQSHKSQAIFGSTSYGDFYETNLA